MRNVAFLISFILFSFISFSQNGQLDLSFNSIDTLVSTFGVQSSIYVSCKQPDGKILIGGDYNDYNHSDSKHITRLDSNGKIDLTFYTGPGSFNGTIRAIAVQADGKILVGGYFTNFSGHIANRIIRLHPDGTKDLTFNYGDGFNQGYVNEIVIQPNGQILVVGEFGQYRSSTNVGIVRINGNGSKDFTFSPAINGKVNRVSLFSDGTMMIGGSFSKSSGVTVNNIDRLNADGTRYSGFNQGTGFSGEVNALCIRNDGKVIVGGSFLSYNNSVANRIIIINNDGIINSNFSTSTGFSGKVTSITAASNNDMIIGGSFTSYNGMSISRLVKINENGVLDASYNTNMGSGVNSDINSLIGFSNGKTFLAGNFVSFDGYAVNYICKVLENGHLDTTFNFSKGANHFVKTSIIQSNGKILMVGYFNGYNSKYTKGIVSVNDDGSQDPTFQCGVGGHGIEDLFIQDDGKIMMSGSFNSYNNTPTANIIRVNTDGTIDNTFNCGTGSVTSVYKTTQLHNGKYIATGSFQEFNGISASNIVGLNSDGSIDNNFNTGTGSNSQIVSALEVSNNKLLLCGFFSQYNGIVSSKVVRINFNGSYDSTFNIGSGANARVTKMLSQPDGKILLGGDFTLFNGVTSKYLIRLNQNGSRDTTFNIGTGFNAGVYDIMQQTNGKIIVSGFFTDFNGIPHDGIVRLYPNGLIDTTFLPAEFNMPYGQIYKTTVLPNQKILISGSFKSIQGVYKNNVARLYNCVTPIGQDNVIACDSFTWVNGITYYNSTNNPCITIITPQGCDSLVYLNLAINHSSSSVLTTIACNNYTWSANNQNYASSGLYMDTLTNFVGCDSLVYLDLTITNPSFSSEDATSCNSYLWSVNNQIYNASGLYVDTLLNLVGCDSIISLNLTIINSSFSSQYDTTCNNYFWTQNNQTYTVSGLYNDTLINAVGCDSIITLHLTINQNYTNIIKNECNSYTWAQNGINYLNSGIYYDTLINVAGCDSIIVLNLTIHNPNYNILNINSCDEFTWVQNGINYTVSGTYIDTILTIHGCDSIVTLNLTILNSSSTGLNISQNNSYKWPQNGLIYTVSGIYTDTLLNMLGCDSIITLNLNIYNLNLSTFTSPSNSILCTGNVNVTAFGFPDFTFEFNNTSVTTNSNFYIDSLCSGTYPLLVTDGNGDTLTTTLMISSDSNYIYNNPFFYSQPIDSIGQTIINCAIFYNTIDTAYIESITANGNTITVIWNIIDSLGFNYDTTSYILNSGNGVYDIQLNVFCPYKSNGHYFTVTQSIYFNNGETSLAGVESNNFSNILIYPNPTNDIVIINFEEAKAVLTIMDIQGRILFNEIINSNIEISLHEYIDGIYLFDLSTTNSRVIKKIMKKTI